MASEPFNLEDYQCPLLEVPCKKDRRLLINPDKLDQRCSRYFYYKDIICCGETLMREAIDNRPIQQASWEAISALAQNLLDPVVDRFGSIKLTYGFCSHKLGLAIAKKDSPRIAPKLDQHAGYELNSKGKRICERGGQACDFIVPGTPSSKIAAWIVHSCPFDRLYYYGNELPVHVSFSNDPCYDICWMKQQSNGRRQPYRYTVEKFLKMMANHDT